MDRLKNPGSVRKGKEFLREIRESNFWSAGWNGALLLGCRGLNMVSQFLLFWVISRQLGQGSLGVFSFVVSTTILGTYLSNLGLDTLITREVSRSHASGESLLSHYLSLRILSAGVSYLVLNGIFLFLPLEPDVRGDLLIYSLCIFTISTTQLFWFLGDAYHRFLMHGALWAFLHLLRAILGILIILQGGTLRQVFLGLFLAEVLSVILTGFVVHRRVLRVGFGWQWKIWGEALRKGWPIAIAGILSVISFRIDMSLLQVMSGSRQVGFYSASFKLVEMMHVIPSSLSLAVFPRLSRAFQIENYPEVRMLIKRVLLLMGVFGFLSAFILYAGSSLLIPLVYGVDYIDSVITLQILTVKILLMFVSLPLSYILISMGDERFMLGILALSAFTCIMADFILIPLYQQNGAAIATGLSEILLLLGYAIRSWWKLNKGKHWQHAF